MAVFVILVNNSPIFVQGRTCQSRVTLRMSLCSSL